MRHLFAAVLLGLGLSSAVAQQYPTQPIKLFPPTAAGSAPDVVARVLGVKLGQQLGQTVVVENRPGANSIVPTNLVAKAPADGYTLLLNTGSQATNPSIYKKLPFDVLKDFAPVVHIGSSPSLVMLVSTKVKANTVQEFIALARAPDSKLSFASGGVGNVLHLAGEYFNMMAGAKMLHVPYLGGAPALQSVISGETDVVFLNPAQALSQVANSKLRVLAVTGPKRMAQLPNVPTLAESGLPEFNFNGGWFAIWAPAGTPAPVIARLNKEVNIAIADPTVKAKLLELGVEPVGGAPADLDRQLRTEMDKMAKIVKAANIQPE